MQASPSILLIQNCAAEGFGTYRQHLDERGLAYRLVHAYRDELPTAAEPFDFILVGGTPVSVYDREGHPYLEREMRFLERSIAAGAACLGVCAGAQLLATLLGAEVRRNPTPEIGMYEVALTEAGLRDPLLRGFPASFPVFHWHADTFGLAATASLLAEGVDCRNQLFRSDRIVGAQFHLETSATEAARWAAEYAAELAAFGSTPDRLEAECRTGEREMRGLAQRLLANFLQLGGRSPGD